MNVSVAESENTYTSITTAAWSHPWPRRRCSVSLCLVWEWFDEKTDNAHVQCLSLQFLFFVNEQKYIYRAIFVHSLHLYTVILLPIYIQYICSLNMSICHLWVSHSCNSKYNLFLLSTCTAQLSPATLLAQLGHLVGPLSLSQDTSKGVESIHWWVHVQLSNERWWYAPVSLVSNLLFSGWPLTSETNRLAAG